MTLGQIIIAILLIGLIASIIYNGRARKIQILAANAELQQKEKEQQFEIKRLTEVKEATEGQLQKLYEDVDTATYRLSQINTELDKTTEEYKRIAEERAQKTQEECLKSLKREYATVVSELQNSTRQELQDYQLVKNRLASVQKNIKDLEAKQLAYIQMKQQEEQIRNKKDYYRLNLSEEDLQDVKFLREVQGRINHKDAIDKIIWEVYYKPAYDILMSHIFSSTTERKCGIYKITCLTNDKSYIGQSVDIRDRWKQHIKSALSHISTPNKLYQEMKSQGIENFIFQVVEEISRPRLNEREVYWIDFYKTRDYGLNSTRGGS